MTSRITCQGRVVDHAAARHGERAARLACRTSGEREVGGVVGGPEGPGRGRLPAAFSSAPFPRAPLRSGKPASLATAGDCSQREMHWAIALL